MRKLIFMILISYILVHVPDLSAFDLRTAAQKSTPKYITFDHNEENKIGGLCVDIMRAIEGLDKNIKFIGDQNYLPFKRMQTRLENGELDVFFGFVKNESRAEKFIFIDPPLYSVKHVVAIRKNDDVNINSFEDIRKLGEKGTILTIFGTSTHRYLLKQEGLIVDQGGKTIPANLNKLLARRGRFVYYHNLGLIDSINRTNLGKKIKILPASFQEYQQYVAFSKKVSSEKVKKVQSALEKLSQSGELKKILQKYMALNRELAN